MNESLEERLARALSECEYWEDAGRRFQETVGDDEIEAARPYVFALGYRLLQPRDEERREISGSAFGQAVRMSGIEFPPALSETEDSVLENWDDYAARADDPIARSRFHDLLWERRHAEAHVHAAEAAGAYLELTRGRWSRIYHSFCVMRALELARSINHQELLGESIERSIELIREDLADEEWSPGIAVALLTQLAGLPPDLRPKEARELIDEAGGRYGAEPFIAESISQLKAGLGSPEEREEIWRRQVEQWRDAGSEAEGLVRYAHRQRALELARNHGLTDLAEEILLDLQSMTVEELDLKTISAEVNVPAEEIDQAVNAVVGDDDWRGALRRFGAEGPPTGGVENNEAAVTKAAQHFPLRRLFPTQIIGAHQALVFMASTEDDKQRLDLVQQEGFGLVLFAPLAVRLLAEVRTRYGAPPEDEFAGFLGEGPIEPERAQRLAQAIGYYWRDEYDAAGHLLAPRLEAAIRHLCVELGVSVIRPPRGAEPGGVVTLGALLEDLRGRMDESWRRYLAHLLSDPLGMNLRNEIGHGLIPAVDQHRAALLIHATCFLARLTFTEPEVTRRPQASKASGDTSDIEGPEP
jgi:Domain of unknown function (DUF4209)